MEVGFYGDGFRSRRPWRAKTYPQELRDRVLAAYARGMKTQQIAEVIQVSSAWVRRVQQVRCETGRTTALPRGGVTLVKVEPDRLRELVEQHPDATAAEYHAMLGVACCVSAVDHALRREVLTRKNRTPSLRNKTART